MVLKAVWGSLGLLLGALGGLLGALWGLSIDQRGPPDSSWNSLGPRLLASCCRKWLWERSGAVFGSFWCSRGPFGGCFGLRQTDFDHQNCHSDLRYRTFPCSCSCSSSSSCFPSSSCSCSCCCSRRFPLTLQLLLDSARRYARSD